MSTARDPYSPTTLDRDETERLAPGAALANGAYTIEAALNAGGFGRTYLARDSLDRTVVIKECLPAELCRREGADVRLLSPDFEARFAKAKALFIKEARALASLSHKGIVGVHQVFEENNTAYMALDHIEGPDLFDLHRDRPEYFTPAECMRIVTALLDALTHVHSHGILHRDISPDNIVMAPDKFPVLIDFGAARTGATRTTRILTKAHMVKDGYSPQEFYLNSSEQGRTSDLYALAATMHHLVKGAPPPNSQLRLSRVAEGGADPYVPLVGTMPGFDGRFLEAIDRCLSLFHKDRMNSAAQWREFLVTERRIVLPGRKRDAPVNGIERRITSLVEETRQQMEDDARKADDMSAEANSENTIGPVSQPDLTERGPEYWAILNEDPEKLAREAEEWRRAEARRKRRAGQQGLLAQLLKRGGDA